MEFGQSQFDAIGSSLGSALGTIGGGIDFAQWKDGWSDVISRGEASLEALKSGWGRETENLGAQAGAMDKASETRAAVIAGVLVVIFGIVVYVIVRKKK